MRAFACLGLAAVAGIGMVMMPIPSSLAHAGQSGPGFDCAKAAAPDEKAICADPQLSAIDRLVNEAYKTFEPAFGGEKKKIARALAADRRACGADTACIANVQNNALDTFGGGPPWVEDYAEALIGRKALETGGQAGKHADQPLPARIGDCAVTHIAELSTRIGEGGALADADPDAGSSVTFTNGGALVSYDHEEGLASSQVGDAVALCLMSIPRDCPQGDDRGKVYYGVDLMLKGTWALPDSQHMCGA